MGEVQAILRNNPTINVNWKDVYGNTALHLACHEGHDSIVTILLAHPDIDVNQKNNDGRTPFIMVCWFGKISCARLLLNDSRVNLREPDRDSTPLWLAADSAYLDIIRWWIASGREMDLGQTGKPNRPQAKPSSSDAAAVMPEPIQHHHHHFDQEALRWREIWGAKNARAVTLVGKSALLMPFVKTCEGAPKDQAERTKELAVGAIDRMVERGYVHRDLRWDHVGLCRSGAKDEEEVVVFIDLGNVDKLPKDDGQARQAAREEMLKALGLE